MILSDVLEIAAFWVNILFLYLYATQLSFFLLLYMMSLLLKFYLCFSFWFIWKLKYGNLTFLHLKFFFWGTFVFKIIFVNINSKLNNKIKIPDNLNEQIQDFYIINLFKLGTNTVIWI